MRYELIKEYYDNGLFTNDDIKIFVLSGDITSEQYTEITGETYA